MLVQFQYICEAFVNDSHKKTGFKDKLRFTDISLGDVYMD